MNEIFLVFLSLSISGSLIALVLLLLKPFTKDQLSKTWQYYVLLIVVVRLLFPFGPDTSLMVILFNGASGNYAVNGTEAIISTLDNFPSAPQIVDNTIASSLTVENVKNILVDCLSLVWLAVAAILLLRKIIVYKRTIRSIKEKCNAIKCLHILELYQTTYRELKIRRPPALAQNIQISSPMLIGAFQPIIALPKVDLKDDDMQYIFQHELTHYRRLDIAYKWLAQIAICLHWFNPLVYWIGREINRNCELSCDEAVIKRLDQKSKYAYGDMLLNTINLHRKPDQHFISVTLNEDSKLIKERLLAIMKYNKKTKGTLLISAMIAALLLCGAACSGVYTSNGSGQATLASDMITQAGVENVEPAPAASALAVVDSTGSYNQDEPTFINSVDADDTEFWQLIVELPYKEEVGTLTQYKNFSRGVYELSAQMSYILEVSWHEGETLTMYCLGQNGSVQQYSIEDGVPTTITVPEDGLYYICAPLNGEPITQLEYSFLISS